MLKIFDFISMTIILVGLFFLPKHKRWWLLYSFGCLCYLIIHLIVGLYGAVVLEICAGIIGLRNYFKK